MAPDPDPGPAWPAGAAAGGIPPWWPPDPTENVKRDLEAERRRADDLRDMQSHYVAQIGEMRETSARYIAELRAQYDQLLRQGEAARIDAIRAVDVGAVNRAAEVSATQAATLATQVATSAEALRGQVEAARQQTATALAAALEPIQKDIQDLRRAQYEAQGKQGQVVESRDVRAETRLNANVAVASAAALIGFLILAVALYAALKH